jgi:hypothetical protein
MLRAVGSAPNIAAVTLAYSIDYAANGLPIPAGIGVLDAGLTGALVLHGVSPVHAAAAVIVYHTIAFCVPGLGGLLAYLRLRPRLLQGGTHTPSELQPASETQRTHTDAETDPSWLGGDAHRRSGSGPLSTGASRNAAPCAGAPTISSPRPHLEDGRER